MQLKADLPLSLNNAHCETPHQTGLHDSKAALPLRDSIIANLATASETFYLYLHQST